MNANYLNSLFSLDGRVAVVTGAARGNGAAIAKAIASAGARVHGVDIASEELQESFDALCKSGLQCKAIGADISSAADIEKILDRLRESEGRCDILVNNAGISCSGSPLEYSPELWDRSLSVNLRGAFFLSQAVAKEFMVAQQSGVIINITSLNAELAFPDNPAYVASKGGLKALTQSLALDLGQYGIRVNAIGPGYIHTEMTARSFRDPVTHEARRQRTVLGRWGLPEDLAGAVIFFAADASRYVTGASLYVDGGWKIKGL